MQLPHLVGVVLLEAEDLQEHQHRDRTDVVVREVDGFEARQRFEQVDAADSDSGGETSLHRLGERSIEDPAGSRVLGWLELEGEQRPLLAAIDRARGRELMVVPKGGPDVGVARQLDVIERDARGRFI